VAAGGDGDITNLITSCEPCNLGKSDKLLSDTSVLAKSRAQMEELQERREQLEMLMAWRVGLRDLADETLDRVAGYWHELAPGWIINEQGRINLKKWLRQFSVEEILRAMDTSAEQYLVFDEKAVVTGESWEQAFAKIPGICRVERAAVSDPDLKELYYIRGILRNRLNYFDAPKAMEWLKSARSWEISLDELREMARRVKNWTQFRSAIAEMIDAQRSALGEDEGDEL
jgi:hypothetical protein